MTQQNGSQQEQLLDEAAAWIARLRSDAVSQRDKSEFSRWLNQSDAHAHAFDEMNSAWETLGAASYLPDAQSSAKAAEPQTRPAPGGWLPRLNLWQGGLTIACVAALVAVIALFPGSPPIEVQTYSTAAGEQRQVSLPDGSVVDLNTRTTLKVAYSDSQRTLTLESGEAYFEVRSNKQRPFVVDVGSGTVTAVGTAFNIYRQPGQTLVTVTEGVVRVKEAKDATTPSPSSEEAVANQQIALDKRGLGQARNLDTTAALAWRDLTLVFDNIPLPKAIDELNRYLSNPVDASDVSLRQLKVSGTFSLQAPQETLQALVTSFNLSTGRSGQDLRLYLPTE